MSKVHRHLELPAESLEPTYSPRGFSRERQIDYMRELRQLSNQIAGGYRARDELLLALATSGSLSRRDMASACGLNKSRVDQILKEMDEESSARQSAAAQERVRRHSVL